MNFGAMLFLRGCSSKLVIASVQYICATINYNANPAKHKYRTTQQLHLSTHLYFLERVHICSSVVICLWVCVLKYAVTVSTWKSAAVIHCSSHCFLSMSWKAYMRCLYVWSCSSSRFYSCCSCSGWASQPHLQIDACLGALHFPWLSFVL